MENDWKEISLKQVCQKIGSGATPRGGSSVYLESGEISLIRSQNIYNERFNPDGIVFISIDAAEKLKNVIVAEDDVLLNITGDSVARCCLPNPKYLPARVNQHVAIIRPKPDILDSRYLRYFLVSPQQQYFLLSLAGAGGTRKALTKGMIENLEILLPPLPEQRAIAQVLGSLDDKIALLRRQNETLEAMAQALFKSWFVDFDPVLDKALAAGHPIPEPLQAKAAAEKPWATAENPFLKVWLNYSPTASALMKSWAGCQRDGRVGM
jgi:type I restriction enzyme S subunit